MCEKIYGLIRFLKFRNFAGAGFTFISQIFGTLDLEISYEAFFLPLFRYKRTYRPAALDSLSSMVVLKWTQHPPSPAQICSADKDVLNLPLQPPETFSPRMSFQLWPLTSWAVSVQELTGGLPIIIIGHLAKLRPSPSIEEQLST